MANMGSWLQVPLSSKMIRHKSSKSGYFLHLHGPELLWHSGHHKGCHSGGPTELDCAGIECGVCVCVCGLQVSAWWDVACLLDRRSNERTKRLRLLTILIRWEIHVWAPLGMQHLTTVVKWNFSTPGRRWGQVQRVRCCSGNADGWKALLWKFV